MYINSCYQWFDTYAVVPLVQRISPIQTRYDITDENNDVRFEVPGHTILLESQQ
jgi:hypothetical protein